MGQDTVVHSGVSVNLPLTFENRKHIYNLFQNCPHSCLIFVQEENEYDEVREVEDGDQNYNFLKDLIEIQSENDFTLFVEKECKKLTFYFLYPVFNAYARNISRRVNPAIYSHTYETPDDIINDINLGRDFFTNLGIPKKDIKFGFSFYES